MSSIPTPTSKRRLADQRPASVKRKRKSYVPLSKAFLRKDFNFPAPESCRQTAAPPRKRACKSPRPKNLNGLDPFKRLGDNETYIIISYLSAKDTETLRRVSKLWKATSEYHCSMSIMKQMLPWAPSQESAELSRRDVNLWYRRQLSNYSNLQLGLATRAIKISGVHDWHLNGKAVVWTNRTEKIFTRTLKGADGTPINSEDEVVDQDSESLNFDETPYVLLSKTGDLVILNRSYLPNSNVSDPSNSPAQHRYSSNQCCPPVVDRLTKITRQVKQWTLELEGSICKPAMGNDALYFMETRLKLHVSCGISSGTAFKKVNLEDGKVRYSAFLPEVYETGVYVRQDQVYKGPSSGPWIEKLTPGRQINVATFDTSLKLAGNEELAVWSDAKQRVHIFSTATGQILFTYDRHFESTLAVSATKPQLWDIMNYVSVLGNHAIRVTTYDTRTEALIPSYTLGSDFIDNVPLDESPFFDVDRPVAFGFHHSMNILDDNTRDPFSTIEIFGLEKAVFGEEIILGDVIRSGKNDEEGYEGTLITLPAVPSKGTKRRLLELETPWMVGDDDFFGLVEGYLVYHHFADKELILIDFWPTW